MRKILFAFLTLFSLIFIGWMAVVHQPKTEHKELVEGTVVEVPEMDAENASVALTDGNQVLALKPRFMPRAAGLKVRMQMTEYQWSGERQYEIKSWSTR